MSQLEDMRLFVDVIDAGSFTGAAEKVGLSKQYLSKRIMALESRLGVRLLTRSTRHLRLTDLGRAYEEQARGILQDVDGLEQRISGSNRTPRGRLRVTAPMSFGTMHLSPVLPKFLLAYPQVSLELDLNDRTVDLIGEGYDLAIRIGSLPDSSLVARVIAPSEIVTCCSPDYLARRGAPQTPAQLGDHACLLYGHGRHVEWQFGGVAPCRVPVIGCLRANNGELVRDAAIGGLGIAYLPMFIAGEAIEAGKLVTILDDYRPVGAAIHAVYPQHRQASLLLQIFVDFLRGVFAAPNRAL
ncbi:LysR family transcriptional regulator [Dyella sp.]|uniref:LysR family transcriptional regulator n=1 Tax=Dyella sp. TaxID=1869338 RepID=UPI002ED42F6E